MKKIKFLFILFVFIISCQKKDYNKEELIKAIYNHSFYPLSLDEVRTLVNKGVDAIKEKDKNFEIMKIKGRKTRKNDSIKSREKIEFFYPFIVKKQNERYLIVKVFDYTIASEAGLKNGILNTLDNELPSDDPCKLNDMISKRDILSISFNDGKADWKMVIKKEMNVFPFVWSTMINNDTGYLNIISLTKNSSVFLKNNVTNLIKRGAKKIIIDLRDVSSGNYEEVAKIIGFFSKDGRNYCIKSSKEGYSKDFQYSDNLFKNIKLAVLVNRKTALLGEVIAQSLKEYGALLIGEKTAGSPYITKVFKVGNNSAARLSVAKLYSPSGKDIDEGIIPDFNVTYINYKKYGLTYVIDCDPVISKAEEVLGKQ
ncbi:MAG: S41 family peptidase [Elusimicrobiales bacterium]|nr:S41 family peptidase [Elusimicrobiales bacterium]